MWKTFALAIVLAGIVVQPVGAEPDKAQPRADAEGKPAWWIGVACGVPVPEYLRQHNLPAGAGLLVEVVVADSPAEAAGVRPGDLLVSGDKKPLRGVQDLIDLVGAAKDRKIAFELLRDGKPLAVSITPAKRPTHLGDDPLTLSTPEWRWLQKFMIPAGDGRYSARLIGPGAILPPEMAPSRQLPDDVEVSIRRAGRKPAEIEVRKGEKFWKVTENRLDQLPAEARVYVQIFLGSPAPMPPAPNGGEGPANPPPNDLQQLQRQIEELKRAIDALRQGLAKPADEPAKG